MSERRVVIPGGSGRIGRLLRHLWTDLAPPDLRPVFLDRRDWDILEAPPPKDVAADLVLDLAGVTGAGPVALNPQIAGRVAEWATTLGAGLIHMSSAAVYSGGPGLMREDDPVAPLSPYGRAKAEGEREVAARMPQATILRLGNLAGADALLGGLRAGVAAVLDPVPNGDAGPVRSYIGPITLARSLIALTGMALDGRTLPGVLNLAQPGTVSMGALLDACGHPWRFGPPRSGVLDRVELATDRLTGLLPLDPVSAEGLVGEVRTLGSWP